MVYSNSFENNYDISNLFGFEVMEKLLILLHVGGLRISL